MTLQEVKSNPTGFTIGKGFSDRFTAKMSGTTRLGNYLSWVADSIKVDGVVDESLYPYPRLQTTPPFLWEDYYAPISSELKALGKAWTDVWSVGHEWVPTDAQSLTDALLWGPIQVTVYAWDQPDDQGVYHDDPLKPRNHAVMLYKADGQFWYIFDHYAATPKKLAWNYKFGAAKRFSVTKKLPGMPILNLSNDTLVQLVEAPGGFGLYLNGKILIDDLAKVLASWAVRNKGNTAGKVAAVTKAQWDSVPHTNLAGQPLP